MSEETTKTISTFTLSCAGGVTFEIPSNTPGLSAGGIQIDDETAISYEAVIQDPDLMPLHFKQFAIANERNDPQFAEPVKQSKKRKWKCRAHRAEHSLIKIRECMEMPLPPADKLEYIHEQLQSYFR